MKRRKTETWGGGARASDFYFAPREGKGDFIPWTERANWVGYLYILLE